MNVAMDYKTSFSKANSQSLNMDMGQKLADHYFILKK